MFGADIAASIAVIVAEIPGLTGANRLAAARTDGAARGDEWAQPFPQLAVVAAIATIRGPLAATLSGAVLERALPLALASF